MPEEKDTGYYTDYSGKIKKIPEYRRYQQMFIYIGLIEEEIKDIVKLKFSK